MIPTDLVELTDARDLVRAGHYKTALDKLRPLLNTYPNDEEIRQLILKCTIGNSNFTEMQKLPVPISEVTITVKNPGCMAGVLFLVIVAAIMTSFFLIFYVFGFALKVNPGLVQEYLSLFLL